MSDGKTNRIIIYQTEDGETKLDVRLENETVWLTQPLMAELFKTTQQNISQHILNIYEETELVQEATHKKYLSVRLEGKREVKRLLDYYSLDMIISVGYRVKSSVATRFRMWVTQRLKDYLVQGYAINERRLSQKNQEVKYLKTGIRILGRAIEENIDGESNELLNLFAKGLTLLDDYDHETLDIKGLTCSEIKYPTKQEYLNIIDRMYSDFESDVFAKQKDDSFDSSVHQIAQSFGDNELYPTLEEKAANLLYLITKNHSFVDGNKRIAAACFLYFLDENNALFSKNGDKRISNEALAALTLFVAASKSNEDEIVKRLIISVLNRNSADFSEQ